MRDDFFFFYLTVGIRHAQKFRVFNFRVNPPNVCPWINKNESTEGNFNLFFFIQFSTEGSFNLEFKVNAFISKSDIYDRNQTSKLSQ